jgi:signal transduction histidine kinase
MSRSFLLSIWMISSISTFAGTIKVFSLPDKGTDLASGISLSNNYLCALSFGSGDEPLSINGVPFQHVHLNGRGAYSNADFSMFNGKDTNYGGTWSIFGALGGKAIFRDIASGGIEGQADGAMSSLLANISFIYAAPWDLTNGSTVSMSFGALTVGKKYSLRYYYRQWNKDRYINFGFCGEGTEEEYAGNPIDLDAGGAAFVEYAFIAATEKVTMRMEVVAPGNGPHFYGVTLQQFNTGIGTHGGYEKSAATWTTNFPSKYGVGWWIWDSETRDQQTCRFWKSFVIPNTAPVRSAVLRISADNYYQVLLDGQKVGQGSEWRSITEYDLSLLLESGPHVLAVEGVNDFGAAGVILGLRVQLKDGQSITVDSDSSWRIVPNTETDWATKFKPSPSWRKAKIVSAAGVYPWISDWGEWGTSVFRATQPQRVITHFWQQSWFQMTLACFLIISVTTVIYLIGRLVMQSKEQLAIQRERARIARDLHDDIATGLTQLVVFGEKTKMLFRPCSEVQPGLDEICLKTRRLLVSLRETVWVVNSQRDSIRDLVFYICDYTEAFLSPTTIRCSFDVITDMPVLPCDMTIRRNLLLGVKEALCNAVKYSEASELKLSIYKQRNEIVVSVQDNGKGFDPTTASKERNGLLNMEQRAKDAGGTCWLVSKPGAGCLVEFRVPLHRISRFRLWRKRLEKSDSDLVTLSPNASASGPAERPKYNP